MDGGLSPFPPPPLVPPAWDEHLDRAVRARARWSNGLCSAGIDFRPPPMFVVFFFFSLLDFDAGTRTKSSEQSPQKGLASVGHDTKRHIEATPVPISAALHPVQSPATAFQQAVSFFLIFEFCLARFFFFFF